MKRETPELKNNYYLEDGKVVFTSSFLKSRGKCCGSACRHCPYEWINVDENRKERLSTEGKKPRP